MIIYSAYPEFILVGEKQHDLTFCIKHRTDNLLIDKKNPRDENTWRMAKSPRMTSDYIQVIFFSYTILLGGEKA